MKKKIKMFIISMVIFASAMAYHAYTAGYMLTSAPIITDTRTEVELPILMYHGITEDASKVNEYTILAKDFEADLVWLKDNGYTSVSTSQLVDYVENGSPLPAKPVLITFDDGYKNNYTIAFELLKKYNSKALISIIGMESDISSKATASNSNLTGYLSWDEISSLSSSDNIEFGNHTYALHFNNGGRKGADKIPSETQEQYAKVLSDDLTLNQSKLYEAAGYNPVAFAWPYGAYPMDGSANEILKNLGFKLTLTSYQIKNTIKQGDSDSLFGLKRFLRTPDFDMNKII
ncbi:MAG: polysaccharide deacetylase family protein [Firmicutes bacterium]|nr:polysaccharide deacetylase family protein [Bacillota bacterium]